MGGQHAGAGNLPGGVPLHVSGLLHQAHDYTAHAPGGQSFPAGPIAHGSEQGRGTAQGFPSSTAGGQVGVQRGKGPLAQVGAASGFHVPFAPIGQHAVPGVHVGHVQPAEGHKAQAGGEHDMHQGAVP